MASVATESVEQARQELLKQLLDLQQEIPHGVGLVPDANLLLKAIEKFVDAKVKAYR